LSAAGAKAERLTLSGKIRRRQDSSLRLISRHWSGTSAFEGSAIAVPVIGLNGNHGFRFAKKKRHFI
jgi:hypothetical protein